MTSRTPESAIRYLDAIITLTDEGAIQRLQDVLETVESLECPSVTCGALFGVLERCSEYEDYGLFWSILHLVERFPEFEDRLCESLARFPCEWTVLMVNGLLNSGTRSHNGVQYFETLERIAADSSLPARTRERAAHFLEFQKGRNKP